MHWIDRGQEPDGLAVIREVRTPRWISFYIDGVGVKPRDAEWNTFKPVLEQRFYGLCGYCEERSKTQIDHFKPKTWFPGLVYEWPNWILSCIGCNFTKLDKWPTTGYVDPCTDIDSEKPEDYFGFDLLSGEMLPKQGLDAERYDRARKTIDELRLNDYHHLKNRLEWLSILAERVRGERDNDVQELCGRVTATNARLSSVAKAWLVDAGYMIGSATE